MISLVSTYFYLERATKWAVAFGTEVAAAFRGIRAQQTSEAPVFIAARESAIRTASVFFYAERAVRELVRIVKSYFPFFQNVWRVITGRDTDVAPNHAWMFAVRDDLEYLGRMAREAWRTIRGDTGMVTEFPWLLSIRKGVIYTFNWIKDFIPESWRAATSGETKVTDRFPWLHDLREQVIETARWCKSAWEDVKSLWAGDGMPMKTNIGMRVKENLDALKLFREEVGRLWEDLKQVFNGEIGDEFKFNFPGIQVAAQDVKAFGDRLKESWDIAKGMFTFLDDTIKRFTFGKIDLATVALVTSLATLTGITRTVLLGVEGLTKGDGLLKVAMGEAAVAAGTAGAVGAAGGATSALTAAGSAATTAGAAAATAATGWGTLGSSVAGVASRIAASPGLMAMLGVGGFALGNYIANGAEVGTNKGMAQDMAGSALAYGSAGAAIGATVGSVVPVIGNGIGALTGGIAGAAYGAYVGVEDQKRRTQEAFEKQAKKAWADQVRAENEAENNPGGKYRVTSVGNDPTAAIEAGYASAWAEASTREDLKASSSTTTVRGDAVGTPFMTQARDAVSGVADAVERVAATAAQVRAGLAPTAAEFAKGLTGVSMSPDLDRGTSSDLFRNSIYSLSPMNSEAQRARSTRSEPQADLAPVTFNFNGTPVRAYQTQEQTSDARRAFGLILGTPASGATS